VSPEERTRIRAKVEAGKPLTAEERELLRAHLREAGDRARFEDLHLDVVEPAPAPSTLTSVQAEQLLVDALLGRPPSIEGDEAEAFYEQLQHEIGRVKRLGGIVDVPNELV
jgi:hypothetical protein